MNKRYSHRFQILSLLWVKPVTSRPKKMRNCISAFWWKVSTNRCFLHQCNPFLLKIQSFAISLFSAGACRTVLYLPSSMWWACACAKYRRGPIYSSSHILPNPSRGGDSGLSSRWWCWKVMISCSFCLFPHQDHVVLLFLSPSSWLWYCSPLSASFLKALCPQFPKNKITNNKTKQRWHDIQKHQSSNLKRWHLQNNIFELLNHNNIKCDHPPILTILVRYPTITKNAKYHKETNVSFANCL